MNQQTGIKGTGSAHAQPKARKAPNQKLLIIGGSIVAVVAVLAGVVFWATRPFVPPKLNAPIEQITRYVDDPRFKKEPFDRQVLYLKVLDDRKEDLKTARDKHLMNEQEFKAALNFAWFGKNFSRMEKYAAMKEVEQERYLRSLAEDDYWENQWKKHPESRPVGWVPKAEEDKRDKTLDKIYPLTWPAEYKLQWDEFQKAVSRAEKAYKKNPAKEPPKKMIEEFKLGPARKSSQPT